MDNELVKCSVSPFAARPWHAPLASLDATSLCTCLVRCPKGLLRCVAAMYVVCKHAGGLVKWESTSGDRCAGVRLEVLKSDTFSFGYRLETPLDPPDPLE